MQGEFLTFHKFPDETSAKEFAEDLYKAGIESRVGSVKSMLDSTIIGNMAEPTYTVKIRAEEFEKANSFLKEYYGRVIDTLDKDYYLFSFSDAELFEIVAKPDEWGHLDQQLAQKLLAERGRPVNPATMQQLKESRKQELAKPEKDGWALMAIGYVIIAAGLASLYFSLGFGFAPYVVVISLLCGSLLAYDKKVLPDGNKVYSYDSESRKHGKIIMATTIIILGFSIFNLIRFMAAD